jgi:hypothetical protein
MVGCAVRLVEREFHDLLDNFCINHPFLFLHEFWWMT